MLDKGVFERLVNRLNIGVIVVNYELEIEFVNHFVEVQYQLPKSGIIQKKLFDAFSDLPKNWLKRKIQGVFVLETPAFSSWEQRSHVFKMRHTRPVTTLSEHMVQNVSFLPLQGDQQKTKYVAIIIEDATDTCFYQQQLEKTLTELEHTSQTDGLTKVANRRYLEERFAYEFSRVQEDSSELSFIMFDMDRFKSINDFYGHQAGDYILFESSQLIQTKLSRLDLLARYGGEEFCIVVPQKNQQQAYQLAEAIRDAVSQHKFVYENRRIEVTISLGISTYNDDCTNFENMITQADIALYQSKREGRNRATCYKK